MKRESTGDSRTFLQHYASQAGTNDYLRSQHSSELAYSGNGSTELLPLHKKTLTEVASPAHNQSNLQSSPSQSPYVFNYTGQKDTQKFNNGLFVRLTNESAPRTNTGKLSGTLQYSGGLLQSNAESNRLLHNFLTDSGVSPLQSTDAKNYRQIEEDQLILDSEMGPVPSTDPNARR